MSEEPQEMMTVKEVCAFFGGTQPVDKSTIYRWVRQKRIPPPLYLGPQTPRWRRSQLQRVLDDSSTWERNK